MKNTTVIPNTEYKRYFHVSLYYFVRLLLEGNNSVRIELTYKVVDLLFRLYVKLFAGIERVEKYAEKLG